jgi:hypothetical protein
MFSRALVARVATMELTRKGGVSAIDGETSWGDRGFDKGFKAETFSKGGGVYTAGDYSLWGYLDGETHEDRAERYANYDKTAAEEHSVEDCRSWYDDDYVNPFDLRYYPSYEAKVYDDAADDYDNYDGYAEYDYGYTEYELYCLGANKPSYCECGCGVNLADVNEYCGWRGEYLAYRDDVDGVSEPDPADWERYYEIPAHLMPSTRSRRSTKRTKRMLQTNAGRRQEKDRGNSQHQLKDMILEKELQRIERVKERRRDGNAILESLGQQDEMFTWPPRQVSISEIQHSWISDGELYYIVNGQRLRASDDDPYMLLSGKGHAVAVLS